MKANSFKELKRKYADYKYGYEWNPEPNPPKYNYIKFAWDLIEEWVQRTRCKWFGHKWHHESYISPESGSESMECTCCGEYHNITWY